MTTRRTPPRTAADTAKRRSQGLLHGVPESPPAVAAAALRARLADELAHRCQLEGELEALRNELSRLRSLALGLTASEASARNQARHDPLTELPNRAAFSLRLAEALDPAGAAAAPVALAVLYIDQAAWFGESALSSAVK